ncbi:MAG: hypothetical protein QME57_00255 [Patescibacteria group bacterium]|nr:hypothetical protein [Patescibacteria group bacterium]
MTQIFIILFFLVYFLSFLLGILIFYHFRRFPPPVDLKTKKVTFFLFVGLIIFFFLSLFSFLFIG